MNLALIIVGFIIALLIIIIVHEMGHFFTSKRAGVKVEEFGIGMPPRLFGIKRGETIYSLNAFPIGAFVRSQGENDPSVPGGLASRGPWTRLLVYSAGPLANILLGFILISCFLMLPTSTLVGNGAMVHSVGEHSPAESAGIMPGDIVLEVDGQRVRSWADMQNAISSSEEGEQVLLLMQRNGNEYTASLEPSLNPELNRRTIGVSLCRSMVTEVDKGSAAYEAGIRAGDSVLAVNGQVLYSPENVQQTLAAFQPGDEIELAVFRGQEGILLGIPPGVSAVEALDGAHLRWVEGTHVEKTRLPVWRALYVGARYTITMPMLVVDAIPLIREDPGKALVGPIGAGQLTVEAVRTFGFSNILFMASVLSLGIALFNFLPIPPLDGGGMLVAFVEGIRRGKRLSHRAIRQAHVIGTAFLITLMILISFNDILRLVQGESFGL